MRLQAEQRGRERLAEVNRVCDMRVAAAEAEAREVLDEAAAARRGADEEEIARERDQALEDARSAREEARKLTSDARAAARDVLSEGTRLGEDDRDLADSLRTNAATLL